MIEAVDVFYGDLSGDGAADALAWGYHNTDDNSTGHVLALSRSEGGQMVSVRTQDEAAGSEPRDVAFCARAHHPGDEDAPAKRSGLLPDGFVRLDDQYGLSARRRA